MLSNDRERRPAVSRYLHVHAIITAQDEEMDPWQNSCGVTYGDTLIEDGVELNDISYLRPPISAADDSETMRWANERDGGIC